MQLLGFHHLTAVTADAARNHAFYTRTLGLRLVKKTVNQDDVSAYHLFYADAKGSPGTDITFFDWPAERESRGTHSIVRTGFRVASRASLAYWQQRLTELRVTHGGIIERDGRALIELEDPEGQRLALIADEQSAAGHTWEKSLVPAEHQLRGLGPIWISVPNIEGTELVLTKVMEMRRAREYHMPCSDGSAGESQVVVFEVGPGGASAELHVAVEPSLRPASPGAGGVHHVAFRVPTSEDYERWNERLHNMRVPSSGPVDRFYFRSLYFREPNGILFELATDEPGFASDEPMETLGEKLSLPPFLESRRKQIEAGLKPLETNHG
ncbi:MAG TPA: ring-cleaving dioxygenase [Tepidisphaeraceae bacterium]|jgi:glyoxalase family protein